MTVREICESLWTIEANYSLLERRIAGVYFWKLIRYGVFVEIAMKRGSYGLAHTFTKRTLSEKVLALPWRLYRASVRSVFSRFTRRDVLVFEHPRKQALDGRLVDIYTESVIAKLLAEKVNFEVVEGKYRRVNSSNGGYSRSVLEKETLGFILSRTVLRVQFSSAERKFLEELSKSLNESFRTDLNLLKMVRSSVSSFKAERKQFVRLLKRRSISQVFLVCSYGKESLIAACSRVGAESIEIQHGTMGRYHLGYSFPGKSRVPYFPNKLLVFGHYWMDTTPLPVRQTEIVVAGFPHLHDRIRQLKSTRKQEKSVLFISQGTIGRQLSKIAVALALKTTDVKITYKLHPGEFERWKLTYPELVDAARHPNFAVVEDAQDGLYGLLGTTEFVVGVYSTAVFEGLAAGCKIVLMDLPGIEYMEHLIEKNIVRVARDSRELLAHMTSSTFMTAEKGYFFG